MIFKNKNMGFSLVELLITIGIISILTTVVFASISQSKAKTRDALRTEDLKTIQQAVESFIVENGRIPTNLSEVKSFFPVNTIDPLTSTRRVYAYAYNPTTKTYCLGTRLEIPKSSVACPFTTPALVGTFTTGTGTYDVNYRITGP